jgi:PAS domain S-box-containing protein
MVDAEGTILLVNRALEQSLGYTSTELLGQSLELVIPDARLLLADPQLGYAQHARPKTAAGARELVAHRKDRSEVAVEIELWPVSLVDRWVALASVVDITARRNAQNALRKALDDRIDFEALVGELGAQLGNLRPDDVDHTIEEALGRLVRTLNLDRSALFEVVEETGDFVHTHVWTRPGCVTPPPRVSAKIEFPWHLAQVRAGEFVCFAAVDEIPDAVDRDGMRRLGTRSGVTIPLTIRGRTWGAITFATARAPRTWSTEILNRLRVVAAMFANVLARKHTDQLLRQRSTENAALRARLRDENAYLRRELNTLTGAPAIVGHSAGIRRVLEAVRQAAATDATVLLVGETGTGKSLLAARMHELSARRARAMVRINCASLAAASVDGDLVAREKGTYLDGEVRHPGLLELASGSTLFLDEVADLPADAQARLARVLQSGEIQPHGHGRAIAVDLRVIAATRRDLVASVKQGAFRDDLYYRLNVLPIHVPPLRERRDDIPLLVWRFVDEFAATYGKTIDTIDQESMTGLLQYPWPGNARELRNVVERAMIVATGPRLDIRLPAARAKARNGTKRRGKRKL